MLSKLKIIAYSDPHLRSSVDTFTFQINPATYKLGLPVNIRQDQGIDTAKAQTRFSTRASRTLDLEFYLDATGVIPGVTNLNHTLNSFKAVAYDYNGDIHQPNYLKIAWGTLIFKCLLKSLNIEYVLFSPRGTPLRAKLNAQFLEHISSDVTAREEHKNSADLTHQRTIRAGDTLPSLCHQIYGRSDYYVQVARANGLTTLTGLPDGLLIKFPPVEQ